MPGRTVDVYIAYLVRGYSENRQINSFSTVCLTNMIDFTHRGGLSKLNIRHCKAIIWDYIITCISIVSFGLLPSFSSPVSSSQVVFSCFITKIRQCPLRLIRKSNPLTRPIIFPTYTHIVSHLWLYEPLLSGFCCLAKLVSRMSHHVKRDDQEYQGNSQKENIVSFNVRNAHS